MFGEEQIFRIDHYLGKETVQNLLALRFANSLFEPLWNAGAHRPRPDHRGRDRGRRGAGRPTTTSPARCATWCRTTCCSCSASSPWSRRPRSTPDAVRDEKLKVLRSLRRIGDRRGAATKTVRGQYRAGAVDGAAVPGYPRSWDRRRSRTETFVALKAEIENWRWAGVPFYLRTGKRLPDPGLGDRDPVPPGAALDLPRARGLNRAQPAGHPPAARRGHPAAS